MESPATKQILLHSFEACTADPEKFGENFVTIETESNRLEQITTLVEPVGDRFVVVNPPYPLATTEQTDAAFDLPFTRLPHPRYNGKGQIPAFEMIKFSVNIHRGCFGGCSFCTISAHQGKFITARSERSILKEVDSVTQMPDFKGYISDLGGPSANMYGMRGRDEGLCRRCTRPSCAFPALCRNLDNSHARLLKLMQAARARTGIKKIFIGSGIRYDLFEGATGGATGGHKTGGVGQISPPTTPSTVGDYLREVVTHHTSGRLKVAPEHTEPHVLNLMRKPPFVLFEQLNRDFCNMTDKYQLIPYFISSHPGCTERDMKRLSEKTRGIRTEQVQDLTPTPMTLSSVMFHTGRNPYTGEKLYVAKSPKDKLKQKSWFFKTK